MTNSTPARPSRLASMIAASIIPLALGACGGGSGAGGGGEVFSTPPPPTPSPQTTPPTPPGPGTVTAPAAATTAPGMAPLLASPSGPNFTTGPAAGTVFPLLQTTLVIDVEGIDADPQANAAGGTATFAGGTLTVDQRHIHAGVPASNGFVGTPDWSGHDNLDWTRVGYWSTGGVWDYHEAPLRHRGVFVAGYETPAADVPTTGTATYSGLAQGAIYFPVALGSGGNLCNCGSVGVTGNAAFNADFGTRNLTGSLTGMLATSTSVVGAFDPWNDVAFSSTIAGNRFSGAAWVTSVPPGDGSLGANAAGTLEGKFFGPGAREAGAVWTLFDGVKAAIGTFTGKRN